MADPSETAFALQCDLPALKSATLLIVDQFEELFTATADALVAPFVKLLLDLADGDKDFRILLTVRADYFNLVSDVKDAAGEAIRGADGKTLFERLNAEGGAAILRLKRISEKGLSDAVCKPLRLAGVSDDQTALIKAVQSDVSDQPSDLPLLQVALKAAWQERKSAGRSVLERLSVGRRCAQRPGERSRKGPQRPTVRRPVAARIHLRAARAARRHGRGDAAHRGAQRVRQPAADAAAAAWRRRARAAGRGRRIERRDRA